jgi:DNA-binding transcriptional LysR family regulator
MELLQLQYFRKVARLQHLSQAARELHITQPALSQTIAKLEKELGAPLFSREGRRIRLNAYGEAFLERVETALEALEEGRRIVADMAGLEKGVVSLDATFIPHFPDVLDAFRREHPDVGFRISQAPSRAAKEELLMSGRIDFCITCEPVMQPGVRNRPVSAEEIVLAVPAGHPFAGRGRIALREAAGEPFIAFKREHRFRATTDALCREAGFAPDIVCEADESGMILDLIRSGLGIALLPESVAGQDGAIRAARILEPVARRTYYLTWKESRYLSQAAAAFRDFVLARFSEFQVASR